MIHGEKEKPTIAVLARSFSTGGAQRVTANICSFLAKRGFEVEAILLYENRTDYPIDPRVKIVDRCPSPKAGKVVSVIHRIASIGRIMRSRKYAAVIDLVPCYRYFNLFAWCGLPKYIASERMYPDACYTKRQRRIVEKAYRKASLVVFQSSEQADCFASRDEMKRVVIPNAVMEGLPARSLPGRDIVTAARFHEQKNLPMLIRGFAKFSRQRPGYRLRLLGEGPDEAKLRLLVQELGIEDAVSLEPFTKNVHEIMMSSTMFVSTSHYEGIQNSLLEAAAIGVPCIATDCLGGSARIVLGDGEWGSIVPVDDVDALADSMIEIVDRRDWAEKRAAVGARELRRRFSPEAIYGQWVDAIDEVVSD